MVRHEHAAPQCVSLWLGAEYWLAVRFALNHHQRTVSPKGQLRWPMLFAFKLETLVCHHIKNCHAKCRAFAVRFFNSAVVAYFALFSFAPLIRSVQYHTRIISAQQSEYSKPVFIFFWLYSKPAIEPSSPFYFRSVVRLPKLSCKGMK